MSAITTHAPQSIGILGRVLKGIADFFESFADAQARSRAFQSLSAMSDAELAAKGLKREDIARYVFRDIINL